MWLCVNESRMCSADAPVKAGQKLSQATEPICFSKVSSTLKLFKRTITPSKAGKLSSPWSAFLLLQRTSVLFQFQFVHSRVPQETREGGRWQAIPRSPPAVVASFSSTLCLSQLAGPSGSTQSSLLKPVSLAYGWKHWQLIEAILAVDTHVA